MFELKIAIRILYLLVGIAIFASCGKSAREGISFRSVTKGGVDEPLMDAREEVEVYSILRALSDLEPSMEADASVFSSLKSELAGLLTARGSSKIAQKPPTGSANKVSDLVITDNGDGTIGLTWSYRNRGDYNQDGTANIGDISILAERFLRSRNQTTGEWDDPVDEVVDGDGNGVINIADISPLAEGFFSSVASYRVLGSNDPMGQFNLLAEVAFSEGAGVGRKVFVVPDLETTLSFVKVQPFDNLGVGGVESDVYTVSQSAPPQILSISPLSGKPGETVAFSAEVVGTPEFTYDWNFDGAGNPSSSSDSTPQVTLTDIQNTYPVTLTVTNDFGSDTLTIDFQVATEPPISLGIGEVVDLGEVVAQEEFTLSTEGGEEYALVLTGVSQVSEGSVPPDYAAQVSYGDRGVSRIASDVAIVDFRGSFPEAAHSGDVHSGAELGRIAQRMSRERVVRRRVSAVGESRVFSFPFDPSAEDKMATLRFENESAELWVDDRVPDAGEAGISDVTLGEIAENLATVILPREINTFGDIYDPDGDGKLLVLFTPAINVLPGGVGGFFSEKDFFPDDFPEESNGADVLYVQVPDPDGTYDASWTVTQDEFTSSVNAVVAHELQHLINSANRIRFWQAHGGSPVWEEYWLNEGLSHFAEDFAGFQPPNNFTSPEKFLNLAPWVYLPGGNEDNPIPARRGAGYLFIRYLVDRFGTEILTRLLMRDEADELLNGWENVQTATGIGMDELLLSWGTAMMLGGLGVSPTDTAYSYQPVSSDPQTGGQHGVRFRSFNQPWSGEMEAVTEPLAFTLSPDAVSSLDYTAKVNTLLFFRLASLNARSVVPLSISNSSPYPIRVFLARVDTGEIALEGTDNEINGKLFLAQFSSADETDTFQFLVNENFGIMRIIALTPAINNFALLLNGTDFGNFARQPYNPAVPPEGFYLSRISYTFSGSVEAKVSALNGGVGWYSVHILLF